MRASVAVEQEIRPPDGPEALTKVRTRKIDIFEPFQPED